MLLLSDLKMVQLSLLLQHWTSSQILSIMSSLCENANAQVNSTIRKENKDLGSLLSKLPIGVDNHSCCRAIEDIDAWAAHPLLQVINGQRDVLCVRLVEDPDLPIRCWARHAMAIIMEQHPLILQA